MTYTLNVCLFSGIFEKCFGLANFAKDYEALITQVSDSEYMQCFRSDIINKKLYKLFCKLSHFFDDFNFYINECIRENNIRPQWVADQFIPRRLLDFIRRVESMKIPQQTKDTIAGFLKMQRAKVALVAIRESPWVVPNLLENENLQIIAAKAKNEEVRKRLIMTTQILQTWGKFPELRLGQLISNSLPEGTDLFYVTDDKLIQLLKDFEANNG
jgi:hypothetical protein